MNLAPHYPTTLVLVALLLLHRFGAHRGLRDLAAPRRGSRPWTTDVLVVLVVVIGAVAVTGGWMSWHPPSPTTALVGLLLCGAGILVTVVSRRDLGREFSIYLDAGEGHRLVEGGIYGRVRHPLYLGELLFHGGAPLVTGAWEAMPLVAALLGVVLLRIRTEEGLLRRRHPTYADYARRTARLLPGIY